LKDLTIDKQEAYKILSNGSYSSTGSTLSATGRLKFRRRNIHLWIFIAGRLLSLSAALALMIYSVSWASDGLWDIATIMFIAGMILLIPFILFVRKIKEIKKLKKYSKKSSAIIGWRHSG
jgi:hypothetical protein